MTLSQINCFLTVARERSITRAANRLYISQPAISKSVSALEKELGFPLFRRRDSGVALTHAGQLLFDFFSRSQMEFSYLLSSIRHTEVTGRTTVRLGCPSTWNPEMFHARLENYFALNSPSTRLDIQCFPIADLVYTLKNRQVDAVLTLRLADRDSEDIPLQPVTQCRCGLVYSKQYFHNVHTIYDLRDADFLVYGNDIRKRLESMIRTACGNRFVPHLRDCGTPSAAVFELSRGTGIMFFTDWDSIVRSEQFGYLLLDGTVAIDALYRDEPGGAELARQLAAAFSDAAPE